MNAMTRRSEVIGYFNKINGTFLFYSFPHDIETALIKGMYEICALTDVGQRSINSACNNNYATLNATANEHTPTQCNKSVENTEGEAKSNEM